MGDVPRDYAESTDVVPPDDAWRDDVTGERLDDPTERQRRDLAEHADLGQPREVGDTEPDDEFPDFGPR